MSTATYCHEVTVPVRAETIWERLQDARTWKAIGPVDEVVDPTTDGDGGLTGFRFKTAVAGRTYWGTAETVERAAPTRMVMSLDTSEMTGLLETDVIPNGSDCTVAVTMTVEAKGFLSLMFFGVVKDAVRRGLANQVEQFGRSLAG